MGMGWPVIFSRVFSLFFSCSTLFRRNDNARSLGQNLVCACTYYKCTAITENLSNEHDLTILERILAREMAFHSNYLWYLAILACVCLAKAEGDDEALQEQNCLLLPAK